MEEGIKDIREGIQRTTSSVFEAADREKACAQSAAEVSVQRNGCAAAVSDRTAPEEQYSEWSGGQAGTPSVGAESADRLPMAEEISSIFPHRQVDIRNYSPLALAFLGDGVYSLIIRTIVVNKGNRQAEKLHNETRDLVSAKAQAKIGAAIQELLTEEERQVYRRGHNAGPEHHAKNATMQEYLEATALETLCGWLYLQNRTGRFLELLRAGLEICGWL